VPDEEERGHSGPADADAGEPVDDTPGEAVRAPASGIDLGRALLAQARADAGARARRLVARRALLAGDPDGQHRSGSNPDDRDPQPVGQTVQRLVSDRGWQEQAAVGGVMGRWPAVVGAEVAAHCFAEGFDAGVLTVRADSTAWATQLRLLGPTLLARLNHECGQGTVSLVKVLGPGGPSWRAGALRVPGRGPRDTYG
jgi:predicted nucleic acid-binding Zn ribbon protein